MRHLLLGALALLAAAAPAAAQTGDCPTDASFVVGPTLGCFRPNLADHNAVDPVTGQPKVVRYEVAYFDEAVDVATGTPISVTPIGKPAVNPQGAVWIGAGTPTPLPAYPLGRRLKAVVDTIGQGTLRSPRGAANTSNPFGQSSPPTAPAAPSQVRLRE